MMCVCGRAAKRERTVSGARQASLESAHNVEKQQFGMAGSRARSDASVTNFGLLGTRDVQRLSDEELLKRTARDQEAFAEFYRRHERALLGVFMRRTGDPQLAAEMTAEPFAAVLLGPSRVEPRCAPALAWTFGIAQNKLLRAWERGRAEAGRRKLRMGAIALEDELLERGAQLGAENAVDALLRRLPPDEARAVRARVIDEQDYALIARHVQTSESVGRQRVGRGLATLRGIVEQPV
jgi:RNA polymerase sigma factor (sigma-70 family)